MLDVTEFNGIIKSFFQLKKSAGPERWLEVHSYLKNQLAIPETCLRVAEDFMVSCPSLGHIAFRVGSRGKKRLVSYTRSRFGHAVMEGWDILNKESWREI